MSESVVSTARSVHELDQEVRALAEQGFRIISVFQMPNGDFCVVAQKESD